LSATKAVIALLLDAAPVAAIVGTRIYPVMAPQAVALPYIVVTMVNEDSEYALIGATGGRQSRVEVACHASSFGAVELLAEAVIGAAEAVIHETVGAEELGPVTMYKQGTDLADISEDRSVFRRLMDFVVRWSA
jgi:hypothetical protein